jgi:putative membrane protein
LLRTNINRGAGEERSMFRALIHWLLSAIALMAVAKLIPGFYVNDLQSALLAALVIGVLNATLGFLLKVITFPFAILTFGIFLLVINAAMIMLASKIVTGFMVYGWVPAFWGAAVLALLGMLIRALMKD